MIAAALLAGSVAASAGAPTCMDTFWGQDRRQSGWPDADTRLAYKVDSTSSNPHFHAYCESAIDANGKTIQTATEIFVNDVGMQLGLAPRHPTISGNPHGQINLYIQQINGNPPGTGTVSVPANYAQYQICDDGDKKQFGDAMAVELSTSSGTKFTSYGFRNNATKNSVLAGETLFSMPGSMSGCKIEVVAELPVPATGDLTWKVEVGINRDSGEAAALASMSYAMVNDEVVISGRPGGNENITLLAMATSVVCKTTKAKVATVTVTPEWGPGVRKFSYAVPRADVASCGTVFWDPTVTPPCETGSDCGASYEAQGDQSTTPGSDLSPAAARSPLAALLVALLTRALVNAA